MESFCTSNDMCINCGATKDDTSEVRPTTPTLLCCAVLCCAVLCSAVGVSTLCCTKLFLTCVVYISFIGTSSFGTPSFGPLQFTPLPSSSRYMFGMKCRESALRFAGNLITELKEGRISTDNPCTYIEYYYYYCGVVGAWCGGGERATRSAILNTLYESPCVSPHLTHLTNLTDWPLTTTHVSPPVYHHLCITCVSFPFSLSPFSGH